MTVMASFIIGYLMVRYARPLPSAAPPHPRQQREKISADHELSLTQLSRCCCMNTGHPHK